MQFSVKHSHENVDFSTFVANFTSKINKKRSKINAACVFIVDFGVEPCTLISTSFLFCIKN